MSTQRALLPLAAIVAGVVAMVCVVANPTMWMIVPVWALGAAYTVGQIRTGYADPPPSSPGPSGGPRP